MGYFNQIEREIGYRNETSQDMVSSGKVERGGVSNGGARLVEVRQGFIDYNAYISSPEWAKKRKARRQLDNNLCRLCDEDGSRYRLEVHHRPNSYAKIPNESVEDDLITVCQRCHQAITSFIRQDRYELRAMPEPQPIMNGTTRQDKVINNLSINVQPVASAKSAERRNNHVARNQISSNLISPVSDAQWRAGKPNQPDC